MNQRQKVGVGAGIILIIVVLASFFAINSSHPKETDYEKYVTGLRNWTISIDEKEVDWLEDVTWNKTYIKDVTVDSKKVDLSKEGTYDLVYLIDIVKKDVDDIEVKKTVKVVDKEKAKEEKEETKETSKDEKKSDAEEERQETKKESKKQESSSKSSSASTSNSSKPSKPKCRTETITIPEQGHNERYLISDVVYEDRPVYKDVEYYITNQTGTVVPDGEDPYAFIERNNLPDFSYRSAWKTVQVSTERVKVKDAVYGERWVVDQPARTETKQVCE